MCSQQQAPAAAEKTEELRGASKPKAIVIVSAKTMRSVPASKAALRVFQRLAPLRLLPLSSDR